MIRLVVQYGKLNHNLKMSVTSAFFFFYLKKVYVPLLSVQISISLISKYIVLYYLQTVCMLCHFK